MKAQRLFLSTLVIFILSAGLSVAGMVDFEAEPINATYGSAYGQSPNDLIFAEDGVLVYITNYYNNGNTLFTFARIKPSIPYPTLFYNGHIFQLNNVGAIFIFTGSGDSTIEYAHFGGPINIEVNNSGILQAAHFSDLSGNVAPGVTMSVTSTNVTGGHKGTITLTGPVHRLRIGGQELFIDEVTGGETGPLPGDDCDFLVDHQSMTTGMGWGGDFGNDPGDDMFVEDGIKVYCEVFSFGGGDDAFGECYVVNTPEADFGYQRVMAFNKFSNFYHIDSLEITTASVSFEILVYEGIHNLKVNNGPLFVGEFPNMPSQVASDVSMVVETFSVPGGYRAEVTLTGDVHGLTVGGEQLHLDNLCVMEANPLSASPDQVTAVRLSVDGNYPNPFNPSTTIAFTTELDGAVELSVVDVAGHRVTTLVDEVLEAGTHQAVWNGRTAQGRMAPAGVYFVQLKSAGHTVGRKISLIK